VESIAKATGIDKVVQAVAGDDCGCDERKQWLNKTFPYARAMNEEEKVKWSTVVKPAWNSGRLDSYQMGAMNAIYSAVLKKKALRTNCGDCVKTALKKLERIYEASCD